MKKKLLITAVIGFIIGSVIFAQTYRGKPNQIRVNVDANGYLSVFSAAQTPPVTQVQFSNARLAVDASGNLLVNCIDCDGTGTIGGSIGAGQVAYGASADTIAGSNNFKWDGTTVNFPSTKGIAFTLGGNTTSVVTGTASSTASLVFENATQEYIPLVFQRYTDFFFPGEFSLNLGSPGGSDSFIYVSGSNVSLSNLGLSVSGAVTSGVNRLGVFSSVTSTNDPTQILSGASFTPTVSHVIDKVQGVGGDITISAGSVTNGYSFHGGTVVTGTASIIDTQWGGRVFLDLQDTSSAGNYFGYEADVTKAAGATLNHGYGYWAGSLFGKSTGSSYPFWYDGGGGNCDQAAVTRINQFGIYAYYNPCFTAYTPDLANFERQIIRWGDTGAFGTSNIGYLGLESSGTGTLRSLAILGTTITFETIPGTKAPVTALTFQPTSGYKSVDGTSGATVTTCTGFKNGLCISGT